MKLSDFDYHLPPERIAQTPAEPRDTSKLLILQRNSEKLQDAIFRDIAQMLGENDVLVVNETKVINARLKGYIIDTTPLNLPLVKGEKTAVSSLLNKERIERGKPCEIFLHKQISENTWDCLVYPGKKLKPGTKVVFQSSDSRESELEATIKSLSEKGRLVEFSKGGQEFLDIIEKIGETPLPPYIKEKNKDASRYQTVYHDSEKSGSVAAPTAGLHFTPELLEGLQKNGVQIEKVCLHVGLGTFANVEVENITEHPMHSEQAFISEDVASRLNAAKKAGKRIIAVGTTSVRTLESFSDSSGKLGHGNIETNIFIYPGYQWKFVDSIITNFHLPKSTLLMLVSSFAGYDTIKNTYAYAIEHQYRFFSYGDALWIQ